MRSQRQVRVPPEYFKKACDEYSDWMTAWWREAFQNSLDAGATSIAITLASDGDNTRVTFSDNGKGMSEETLINTFLALGGSEKPDDAIGGFGYAKNLLCFAHKQYSIQTGRERILGVGGDYEHWKEEADVKGVTLDVQMDDRAATPERLQELLEIMMNASRLPAGLDITLNGEPLVPRHPKMPFKTQTELGDMRFSDTRFGPSRLWVRMGGLAMFPVTVYTGDSHFRGILDLNGSSKEMLTSNRDSLRSGYASQLQDLVQKLSTERSSLKCNDLLDLTLNFEAAEVGDRHLEGEELTEEAERVIRMAGTSRSLMSDEQAAQAARASGHSAFGKLEQKRDTALDRIRQRLANLNTADYPKNFRIRTAEMSTEGRRDPAAAYTPILRKLEQDRVQKMARAWDAMVKAVLSQPLCEAQGIDWEDGKPSKQGRPINTGFVFSDQYEGLHLKHPDGAYDVLFNPDTMPRFDVEDMLDVAIHETAHLWVAGHYESFTTMEASLRRGMRKFMPIAELRKVVRAAINGEVLAPKAPPANESARPPESHFQSNGANPSTNHYSSASAPYRAPSAADPSPLEAGPTP